MRDIAGLGGLFRAINLLTDVSKRDSSAYGNCVHVMNKAIACKWEGTICNLPHLDTVEHHRERPGLGKLLPREHAVCLRPLGASQ